MSDAVPRPFAAACRIGALALLCACAPPAPAAAPPQPVALEVLSPPEPGAWHSAQWVPADWANPPDHSGPYRADHVVRNPDGVLDLILDAKGEAGVVQGVGRTARGRYAFSFVVPPMHDGQDAAAFLYDNATRDEVDVEVVGRRGLQLNVHHDGQEHPVWPANYRGDLSGRTITGVIEIDAGRQVTWSLDGREVLRLRPTDVAPNVLPSAEMAFIFNNTTVLNAPKWIGRWKGLRGARSVMHVLGFRYTPLPDAGRSL